MGALRMQAWGFTVRGEGSDTLEIDIYDVVGDDWFFGGVSARSVRRTLKQQPNAKTIKLRINSEGGDVFDGFAIYNLLNEHPARVEVDIDALAASVASIIAMAADEVRIASNAWIMIHNAWGMERGEASDLRRWADVLEKMSGQAAQIYAARTGMQVPEVQALMDAETWMTADEAKAKGFVDKVIPAKKSSAKAQARAFARMSVDDYANVPDQVRELVQSARAQRQLNPGPGAADDQQDPATGERETCDMAFNKKALAKLLGISESASDEAHDEAIASLTNEVFSVRAHAAALEKLTGKSGEEALGVVLAWKGSHEELPAVSAKLAKLEGEAEATQLDTAIAKAKTEHRWTPAREAEVRKLREDGDCTLKGAIATVGAWGVIAALRAGADGAQAATGAGDAAGSLKHNDKTYAEMNSGERSKLKKENLELFEAMRKQAKDNGEI